MNGVAKSFLLHTIQIVTTPSLVAAMLCVLAISAVQGYKRSSTQMPLTMQQPQPTDHAQRIVALHPMAEGEARNPCELREHKHGFMSNPSTLFLYNQRASILIIYSPIQS